MLVGPTKDGEKEMNEIGRGLGSAFSDRAFAQVRVCLNKLLNYCFLNAL